MELHLHSPIHFQILNSEDFTVFFPFFGTNMQNLAERTELKGMRSIHVLLVDLGLIGAELFVFQVAIQKFKD